MENAPTYIDYLCDETTEPNPYLRQAAAFGAVMHAKRHVINSGDGPESRAAEEILFNAMKTVRREMLRVSEAPDAQEMLRASLAEGS